MSGEMGSAVGVGLVLAGGVGAECTELLSIFEVDAADGLAERAVGLDAVGGDAGAVVVGDVGRVAGFVDGDIGRAAPPEVTWLVCLSAPVFASIAKVLAVAAGSLMALTA